MIDQSFNLKNPLYNVKEVIFLTTEMTGILVIWLRQNRPFSLLLCRFIGAFMPD